MVTQIKPMELYLTSIEINASIRIEDVGQYGSTGCQVFKRGVQNWKDLGLKINPNEIN